MKECDILGVKTYSDPSYIFSGVKTPNTRVYPLSAIIYLAVALHRLHFYNTVTVFDAHQDNDDF